MRGPARTHAADPEALLAALRAHTEQGLGRFKRPDAIHLVDDLPRSPTGKLLRRRLRDLLPKEKLA